MSYSPERIVALVPNWLGDAAMCTPALRAIKNRFPQAQLTVAGRASACCLLESLSFVDKTFVLPARPNLIELVRLGRALRPHGRDLTVVFPHSLRSALLARLTGSKRRAGYVRNGRGWLLTDRVAPYCENGKIQPVYMGREYLDLVAVLGCADDNIGLELAADPADVAAVRERLTADRPRVGIAPGAAFGPSKMWPAERYAKVADALSEGLDAQCVLLTGPGEEQTRQAVLETAKRPFVDMQGAPKGIGGLKAVISQLDLLIGNDSGTRHIAVAFKVPTVCIMGSTSPRYSVGPYERGRLLRVDVDCGPCQKPVCTTDHRCMTRISVEMVADAASEVLAGRE